MANPNVDRSVFLLLQISEYKVMKLKIYFIHLNGSDIHTSDSKTIDWAGFQWVLVDKDNSGPGI